MLIVLCTTKGKLEAAKRLSVLRSDGYPTTDEMPYLAEMLQGKIELVDFEEPTCPMTTYGDDGPVLFRIAHQTNAQDSLYVCDHWVFSDMGSKARKEAKQSQDVEERPRWKKKP